MADDLQSLDSILGEEFLTWLWYKSDTSPDTFKDINGTPFSVYMEQRIVVQGGQGQGKETAIVSGSLSPLAEARFGLGTGKKVTRAMIRIEKDEMVFQFLLRAEDFCLGSLKTPKIDISDRDNDPDALLLEKIFFIETCMNLLDGLFKRFLMLRLSDNWQNEISYMVSWFSADD